MFPRPPHYGEDVKLRTEIVRVLSLLPEGHPARQAYDNGAMSGSLLRLLKEEPEPYEQVLKAVMEWTNRVIHKTVQ
jgi:hypothetical protein